MAERAFLLARFQPCDNPTFRQARSPKSQGFAMLATPCVSCLVTERGDLEIPGQISI